MVKTNKTYTTLSYEFLLLYFLYYLGICTLYIIRVSITIKNDLFIH